MSKTLGYFYFLSLATTIGTIRTFTRLIGCAADTGVEYKMAEETDQSDVAFKESCSSSSVLRRRCDILVSLTLRSPPVRSDFIINIHERVEHGCLPTRCSAAAWNKSNSEHNTENCSRNWLIDFGDSGSIIRNLIASAQLGEESIPDVEHTDVRGAQKHLVFFHTVVSVQCDVCFQRFLIGPFLCQWTRRVKLDLFVAQQDAAAKRRLLIILTALAVSGAAIRWQRVAFGGYKKAFSNTTRGLFSFMFTHYQRAVPTRSIHFVLNEKPLSCLNNTMPEEWSASSQSGSEVYVRLTAFIQGWNNML